MAELLQSAQTRPYSTDAFNALPDFGASKSRFFSRRHALDEMGEVIRRHGLEKYLGAALIHKHFPLESGERVVELVTPDGAILLPRADVDEESVVPYLWHLNGSTDGGFRWVPVEFVEASCVTEAVRELGTHLHERTDLLAQLGGVVAGCGAEDTFGLALLHRQRIRRDLGRSQQILLESPGPFERSLVVSAVPAAKTTDHDYTQTYWHFDVDAKELEAGCSGHGCAGYCSKHG